MDLKILKLVKPAVWYNHGVRIVDTLVYILFTFRTMATVHHQDGHTLQYVKTWGYKIYANISKSRSVDNKP